MHVRGISDECAKWWKETAIDLGYYYRGRPSVKELFEAIYKGEIRLVKVLDKDKQ